MCTRFARTASMFCALAPTDSLATVPSAALWAPESAPVNIKRVAVNQGVSIIDLC